MKKSIDLRVYFTANKLIYLYYCWIYDTVLMDNSMI